ncbi:MAG: hypothetical protein ACRDYZ_05540 [Acidimicrobiales bacterium]
MTAGPAEAWSIDQITGLGVTSVRTGDSTRPRDTGQLVGLDLLGGRDVALALTVVSDGTSLQNALKRLAAALQPGGTTETPFWFQLPGLPQLCSMVRVRKRHFPIDLPWSAGLAKVQVLLHSTDPRLYAPTQTSTANLPTPLGGMTFPATFPLSFGGGSATGDVTIDNTGNVEMRPILVITGPCTSPKVANDQAGWSLTFTNPAQTGFTLSTGESLIVDTGARTVLLTTGTGMPAPHENWVVPGSTWPSVDVAGVQPGANTLQFSSSDATTVAGQLSVHWAPAFLL